MTAETFARSFAHAFAAQDADAITALLAEDGELLSLTGQLAEGQKSAQLVLAAEFEGIFARARLVTGKGQIRPLGTGRALLRQRFVVTGALDANGAEMPRFGAVLIAVLAAEAAQWRALHLSFVALP